MLKEVNLAIRCRARKGAALLSGPDSAGNATGVVPARLLNSGANFNLEAISV